MKPAELAFRLKRRATNEVSKFKLKHNLSGMAGINLKFLFTCRRGIYLFDRGAVTELAKGPHFGITAISPTLLMATEWIGYRDVQGTVVYPYEYDGKRLVKGPQLKFRDKQGQELRPYGIHQLRYLNGFLWVVNTRENVVWKCNLDGEVLSEWSEEGKMPFDEANYAECNALRKRTEEYRHYNSISFHDGHYYVLAHNCTQHALGPDKKSYIVKLNEALEIVERIPDSGRACHDLYFSDNKLYVCSSLEGTLMEDGEPFLNLGAFLRGVGQIGSIMIVGGSPHESDRVDRDSSHSKLFFVDRPGRRLLYTLELGPLGNILDVLCLDEN